MRSQSQYMRMHARARASVKEVIEMPDAQLDRAIQSVESNNGVLTKVLAKEMPELAGDGVWEVVVAAVRAGFARTDSAQE